MRSIAEKTHATGTETNLRESGAVYAHEGAATPEIGCVEILLLCHSSWADFMANGKIGTAGGGFPLFVVDPTLIIIPVASNQGPFFLLIENDKGVVQKELVNHFGAVGRFAAHGYGREKTIGTCHIFFIAEREG